MSFSSTIKDELCRLQSDKACCQHAELAGILRTGLMLREQQGEKTLLFITEHGPMSRFLYSLVKGATKSRPVINGEKSNRFNQHVVYRLDFHKMLGREQSSLFLQSFGIHVNLEKGGIEYSTFEMNDRCCMRAYLRGGFLSCGSVTSPDKSYHLEMAFIDEKITQEYMQFMEQFELKPKHITRKGYQIVYIKEGQEIVDFLNVIGAHNALMEMENIRILKDMRNQVNRIVNCETANLEKIVNASVKQVEYIKYLDETVGLENLPIGLKEIARLRLDNPEVSLSELGKMLNPVLGKSGVNHRLRKLEKLALDRMDGIK